MVINFFTVCQRNSSFIAWMNQKEHCKRSMFSMIRLCMLYLDSRHIFAWIATYISLSVKI